MVPKRCQNRFRPLNSPLVMSAAHHTDPHKTSDRRGGEVVCEIKEGSRKKKPLWCRRVHLNPRVSVTGLVRVIKVLMVNMACTRWELKTAFRVQLSDLPDAHAGSLKHEHTLRQTLTQTPAALVLLLHLF